MPQQACSLSSTNSSHLAYNLPSKEFSAARHFLTPLNPCLPITLQLLQNIYPSISPASLLQQYPDVGSLLPNLFGFLWVSKFTTPSDTHYDKDCRIGIDDISIDSRDNPPLLKVTLKQSKTDPIVWVLTSTWGSRSNHMSG